MKDYVHYLQDVLGLDRVMLADLKNPTETKTTFWTAQGAFQASSVQHFEIVFLNLTTQPKESLFRAATQDLFAKMKSAMRLKNVQVIELDAMVEDRTLLPSLLADICQARYVVVLSSFPQNPGEIILKGTSRWIETYSPSYLLEDADAKKIVWTDLQKVMKELSL
jgi:hypothetical protein